MERKLPPDFSEENALIGEIVTGPTASAMYEHEYNCTIRPLGQKGKAFHAGKAAYLMLASGELVPIVITGIRTISPTPETIRSGAWHPLDTSFLFRAPDATDEQVQQACTFILP